MWQELRNQAANACFQYVQEAGLLGPLSSSESSHEIKTWVPETLKAQTAAYALQWHRAIPIKGIIIGQSPTAYDKGSPSSNETAPHLAASFAFMEGAEPPAASEILANEFKLCGKDGAEALDSIRDCWNLVEHGVLSVHALPLGMENRFDWSPATASDVLQMQLLAKVLCHLISLSAEMRPRGSTRVVAMGRWAHDLASELRRQFTDKLHAGQSKYWTLDVRASLSHPTRTWHKFQTRTPETITMGREEDLLALYELFTAGKNGSTLHTHGNGTNGNGNGNGDGASSPLGQATEGRSRVASYLDGLTNGMTGLKAAVVRSPSVNGSGPKMAPNNGNENGALSGVRSSFNYGYLADCSPIGYSRMGPGPGSECEPGDGVLSEIKVDSNSLDMNGNAQWPERGPRCGSGPRAERIVPVFGTGNRNVEQEQKLLFNRDFQTRAG